MSLDQTLMRVALKKVGIGNVEAQVRTFSTLGNRTLGSLTDGELEHVETLAANQPGSDLLLSTLRAYRADCPDRTLGSLLKEPSVRALLGTIIAKQADAQHIELTEEGIKSFFEERFADLIISRME